MTDNSAGMVLLVCKCCGREFTRYKCNCHKEVYCSKECYWKFNKGTNHYGWKGGKLTTADGYINIYNPDHIRADKNGYVYEHIMIMEKHLGRHILPTELVHHRNGDKSDNMIDNLEIVSKSAHMKTHKIWLFRWSKNNGN